MLIGTRFLRIRYSATVPTRGCSSRADAEQSPAHDGSKRRALHILCSLRRLNEAIRCGSSTGPLRMCSFLRNEEQGHYQDREQRELGPGGEGVW